MLQFGLLVIKLHLQVQYCRKRKRTFCLTQRRWAPAEACRVSGTETIVNVLSISLLWHGIHIPYSFY